MSNQEQGEKTDGKRKKHPKQIYLDWDLKTAFDALVRRYDPDLDASAAIVKLIRHAVQDNWLPGYIRKTNKVISNKIADDVIMMENSIDNPRNT
jgi:hypothetical protein